MFSTSRFWVRSHQRFVIAFTERGEINFKIKKVLFIKIVYKSFNFLNKL